MAPFVCIFSDGAAVVGEGGGGRENRRQVVLAEEGHKNKNKKMGAIILVVGTYQSEHAWTPSFQVTLENFPLAQGVHLYLAGVLVDIFA